jgi:hypothetical protein
LLALVDRKPLSDVWQLCYFWSLPYYLVGAATAGIMTATSRTADWLPKFLVLPLMGPGMSPIACSCARLSPAPSRHR